MPQTFIYKIAEKAYEIFDAEKVEDHGDIIDAVGCGRNYIDVECCRMGIHLNQINQMHIQYLSLVKQRMLKDHGIDSTVYDYDATTSNLITSKEGKIQNEYT